jgi:betaine reductase
MTKEIEKAGIPTVHVTNLVSVAENAGAKRILPGRAIPHVFGDPSLTPEEERRFRRQLVEKALSLLASDTEHAVN